jgi:hypothetical protein
MWRIAATLLLAALVLLVNGSTDVSGQTSCGFVGGFATLRELVGAQKVGACLEDEHFNIENQNAEQRTSGGLLVWRKVDNFTAFTDGATSWINGPNGLQTRPNSERFSWESDPIQPGRVVSAGGPAGASTPARSESPPPPPAVSSPVAVAQTATPRPTSPPTATTVPTVTRTPTKTPNPIKIKVTEQPDEGETGNEVKFEIETSGAGKKATCSLSITYNDTDAAGVGAYDVDDDKCEWKFLIPPKTKTGTAKYVVTVSGENGSTTEDGEFRVKKGDVEHAGDVKISLEIKDAPDDVTVGENLEVQIETDVGNKGTCEMTATWPKSFGSAAGESKHPDGGKCSWAIPVPTTITKSGQGTINIAVKNKSGAVRTATKEFDVKLK